MKHCIFQYWLSRPVLPGACYSRLQMSAYASRFGADYCFHDDGFTDRIGVNPRWFDKLRPVYDSTFDEYDKVLVLDMDIFPVDGITASIFDEPLGDFGMCEEPDQPEFRERFPTKLFSSSFDRRWVGWVASQWGCKAPVDAKGRPRVWNAGLILLTRSGREKMRQAVPAMRDYVAAAKAAIFPQTMQTEQSYLNALAWSPAFDFTELSCEWNRQIHKLGDGSTYDRRNRNTKFVHVMLPAADHQSAEWHHDLVNSTVQHQGC